MIGDKITIKADYFSLAEKIYLEILKNSFLNKDKLVISIAGESGCGKSVTGEVLKIFLKEKGIETISLQQDDYFFLPPKTNHENRLKNIENVGLNEVNLELLQRNINDFKSAENEIEKPLVNYIEDTIVGEEINLENAKVLIIEGTYVNTLKNIDFKIFIETTYKDTLKQRIERGREKMSDFIEKILFIEHDIIKKQHSSANLLITKDYQIKPQLF